ncbi:Hypothetical predicted protein, partial [Pelobates cultripes]
PSLPAVEDVTSEHVTTCQGRRSDARTSPRGAYVISICTAARTSQAPTSFG